MGVNIIPGRVTGRSIGKNKDGDHNVMLLQTVVSEASDVRVVELMTHHGQKNSPPVGSKVTIVSIGKSWKVAVACDDLQAPGVNPGENRLYSTDSQGGSVVAEIYLKNDGNLEISVEGAVTITAPGGVEITAPLTKINGDVLATGTIMAPNIVGTTDVTFGGVSGVSHVHPENDNDGSPYTDPPVGP